MHERHIGLAQLTTPLIIVPNEFVIDVLIALHRHVGLHLPAGRQLLPMGKTPVPSTTLIDAVFDFVARDGPRTVALE